MYTVKQLSQLYSVAIETIRKQSIEFRDFLSPTANPGDSRTRLYVDSDLEIFSLIVDMKSKGRLYADIKAALANGQRGTPPDTSAIVEIQPTERGNQIASLQLEIEILRDQISRRDAKIELLTQQLEEKENRLLEMYVELRAFKSGKGD